MTAIAYLAATTSQHPGIARIPTLLRSHRGRLRSAVTEFLESQKQSYDAVNAQTVHPRAAKLQGVWPILVQITAIMGKPWRRAASPRYRGRLCGYEVVRSQRKRLALFLVNVAQVFCPGDTWAFVALCEFKEHGALRGKL